MSLYFLLVAKDILTTFGETLAAVFRMAAIFDWVSSRLQAVLPVTEADTISLETELVDLSSSDSQEAFDNSVQQTLSKLYPPFRSTAPVIIGQVCQIVDSQFAGDGRTFLTDFLLPAKIQLQVLREEAKIQLQVQGRRRPKDEGWPICFDNSIIVHFREINDELLKPGDFYFQLKSPVPGTILLALTYFYHGRIHSILIPQDSYEIVFTMEWLQSLNPDENRMALEHCVLSTECGIERISWEDIIRPPLTERRSRRKSGNKENRKSQSSSVPATTPEEEQILEESTQQSGTMDMLRQEEKAEDKESPEDETQKFELPDHSPSLPQTSICNNLPRPIQMLEVNFEVLHSGAAILTGARDTRGGAVMEIYSNNPIWKHLECCSEEITKVFMYYNDIPREEVKQLGMSVVVDARGASTSVLEVIVDALFIFESNRPGAVNIVHVLLEANSPLLYLNSTLFRPTVNFQFELLPSVEALHKLVPAHQLTHGFNGTFPYNHESWIRFRMKLEPFMAGCHSAAKFIIGATQDIAEFEKPDNAQETISLVERLEWTRTGIYEDARLVGLQTEGDAILSRLKNEQSILTKSEDFRDSIDCVTMLYNKVHQVVTTLDGLAETKLSQLEHHLQLKLFEEQSMKVASWICNEGEAFLNNSPDIGDTLQNVKAAGREFDEFYFNAMKHVSEGEDLLEEASMLVQQGHSEAVGIKDQAKTLKQHLKTFIRNVEERRELVEDFLSLYTQLSHVEDWVEVSVKHLAMMSVEDSSTREGCEKLQKDLEQFQCKHPIITQEQFDTIEKLAIKVKKEECQEELANIRSRCKDIEQLLQKKLNSLENLREQFKSERAKQRLEIVDEQREGEVSEQQCLEDVTEEVRTGRTENQISKDEGSDKSTNEKKVQKSRDSSLGSSASEDSGISENNNKTTPNRTSKSRSPSESDQTSADTGVDITENVIRKKTKGKASTLPDPCTDVRNISQDVEMKSDGTAENEEDIVLDIDNESFTRREEEAWSPKDVNRHLHKTGSLPLSIKLDSGEKLTEDEKKRRKKMMHIMGEMLQTERDYVRALNYIIQNYFPEMEREDIPQALRGQRGVVFGNLEKIYDFHYRHFLKALEQCENVPLQLHQCFLQYKSQLNLYALYNKNKPKSDILLAEHGSFFKTKQKQLGDKMDLASYLLKPTQRMGKYALLLKDLIKECAENEPELPYLEEAEQIVKFQLRHGNDLLAMDSLRDCDVNLKEQGRLLRQDEFLVYHGRKKYLRHIFLFEDLLLFSKTKKTNKGHDVYHYKSSIKTSDIGLTENIGASGMKFEIWFRKRKANETYIMHAPTHTIKNAWVNEVRMLLMRQALRSKESRIAELQSMGIGQKPCIDIKPSKDQISNRAIDYVRGRGSRNRNSIAICNFDHTTPPNQTKRPLSIISVSSSSSTGSGSSVVGSLALANFDTVLQSNTSQASPKTRHRHSTGAVSVSSVGSSSSSEVSYQTVSPPLRANSRTSVNSNESGQSQGSNHSSSQFVTNV
ncbi:puratrophin-1-like isoform X4 [Ptychodera flava]|uniref:puratrophin-1-like isoform X4 n=1 Tax=Ptychodera flava TaxID=63121 RepID=UPI003969ED78